MIGPKKLSVRLIVLERPAGFFACVPCCSRLVVIEQEVMAVGREGCYEYRTSYGIGDGVCEG